MEDFTKVKLNKHSMFVPYTESHFVAVVEKKRTVSLKGGNHD